MCRLIVSIRNIELFEFHEQHRTLEGARDMNETTIRYSQNITSRISNSRYAHGVRIAAMILKLKSRTPCRSKLSIFERSISLLHVDSTT